MPVAHVQLLKFGVFVTLVYEVKAIHEYDKAGQFCNFADGSVGFVETEWFPTLNDATNFLECRMYSDWNPLDMHLSMDFQNWSLKELRLFAEEWQAIPETERPKLRSRVAYVTRLNAWLSRQLLSRFVEWDGWEVV